jgi:hypothetical protein
MADMTANPWIFLNADEGATIHATKAIWIRSITYTDYNATTDAFEVQDADGKVIASGVGNVELDPETVSFGGAPVHGIQIQTCGAPGKLLVYID